MAPEGPKAGSKLESTATRYGLSLFLACLAVYLRVLLQPFLATRGPFRTVWPVIVITSWYCGLGPSILALIISLGGVWYWIVSFHGATTSSQDVFGMLGFVAISGLIIAIGEVNRRSHAKLIAAETEARQAKGLFEAFMENSPTLTYLKDEEGRYLYANRAALQRFGLPSLVGKTDADFLPAEIAREVRDHDLLVLRENGAQEFTEHTLEGDGKHTWLVVKFPVVGGDGKRLLAGKSLDITDRQRAEEALLNAQQELELRVKERTAELSRANDSLRELSARLLQMRDDERRTSGSRPA